MIDCVLLFVYNYVFGGSLVNEILSFIRIIVIIKTWSRISFPIVFLAEYLVSRICRWFILLILRLFVAFDFGRTQPMETTVSSTCHLIVHSDSFILSLCLKFALFDAWCSFGSLCPHFPFYNCFKRPSVYDSLARDLSLRLWIVTVILSAISAVVSSHCYMTTGLRGCIHWAGLSRFWKGNGWKICEFLGIGAATKGARPLFVSGPVVRYVQNRWVVLGDKG